MSAVSSVKLKANCNAVSSGSFINQSVVNSSIAEKSSPNNIKTSLNKNNNIFINNGTNLNQSSINCKPVNESAVSSYQHHHHHNQESISSDVQKVLKQEQELQKQLYSGSNNAPGWLRVNHNNKVIYIR